MKYLILIIATLSLYQLSAQRPIEDRLKAEKIGHITTELSLTAEEATTFWPVYNKYEDKREKNRKALRYFFLNNESDQTALSEYMALKEEEHTIEVSMIEALKEVISDQKIIQLLKAEQSFKRELMRKVKRKFKDKRGMN